jgi:beta-galactosidase/beta-glucuronidase
VQKPLKLSFLLLFTAFQTLAQSPTAPILSRWEKAVTPQNAWREYPRPQLVRERWQNLNGLWEYAIRPKTEGQPAQFDGPILVPFCVESALSKVGKPLTPSQRLWYQRTFSTPTTWQGQRVLLHFDAVDYECSLWVNGGLVGSHTGGSDPFQFDITDFLNGGTNTLVLAVTDPTSEGEQPRGKQLLQPQGIWYTPVSGIWQTVWLEPVPTQHVVELRLTPELDSSRLRVQVVLARPTDNNTALRVTALDGTQTVGSTLFRSGREGFLNLPNPKRWSPDNPFLYGLRVEVLPVKDPLAGQTGSRPRYTAAEREAYARAEITGAPLETVTSYFAMRKISVGPGPVAGQPALLLNGQPLFQNGPLDQGWWPGGLLTPPSDEAMVFELDFLKKAGFNMLRKHIKVEPARYYYHCDRLGMLVWQDMPSGFVSDQNLSPRDPAHANPVRSSRAEEQFELELRRMINHLYNHPSIVTWVVHNEGWGQYDTPRMAAWVKGLDPSRLVNAASGWTDQNAGDFYDIHTYEPVPNVPSARRDRAIVVGEFGGIGWPIQGHLWQPDKRNWGYQTYQSQEEVIKAYRTKYAKMVEMAKQNGVSAAVYTQTTDVEGEVNGLLTYDREVVKIPVETLRAIHAPLFGK